MLTSTPTFTRRPVRELVASATVWLLFVTVAVIGTYFGHATIALNGFIIAVGVFGLFQGVMFWLSLRDEIDRSDAALRQCSRYTAKKIRALARDAYTPVAQAVLQDVLIKAQRGRGSDHAKILQAYETSMLEFPERLQVIAKGWLPSLGMAGTVFGLELTMIHISQGIMDAKDVQALNEVIMPAIGTLGMAFTTTLTALLFGSLLLGVHAAQCRRAVQQFIDQLDAQLACFQCQVERSNEE